MRSTTVRASALILSLALVATGAPAFAAEEGETPLPAIVSLTTPPTLTLPAGDGIRDAADVTLSSDIATTVTVDVVAVDGVTVLRTQSVPLTDGALSAPVTVSVADLPAGALALRATPAAGDPVVVPLVVGSGRPASVALSLSAKTIYTWAKSATRTSVATVSAADETGLAVPFAGTVTAKVGAKSQTLPVSSATGSAATATLSAAKLAPGSATVTATVTGNGSAPVSAKTALTVKNVGVAATALTLSSKTLYPARDGYLDATKIVVRSTTTTGAAVPATGTVKVALKGKTVRSWKLTSSKAWSARWDGKVKGKIVPGTYTVTVTVKGPEGTAKSAQGKVVVKKGQLVTKTAKKTVKANTVLTSYADYGDWYENACWQNQYTAGDIFCDGDDSIDGTISVMAAGVVGVPGAVVAAEKFGGAKVRMSAQVSSLYGAAMWGYWRADSEAGSSKVLTGVGKSTLGWLSLPATTRKLDVILALGEYSFAGIDTFTIEYRYKVMTTK